MRDAVGLSSTDDLEQMRVGCLSIGVSGQRGPQAKSSRRCLIEDYHMSRPIPCSVSRSRLLDCTAIILRNKSFNAVTIDELCKAAGVSKGAFYHHFESKAVFCGAAVGDWSTKVMWLFDRASYHGQLDALDRVLGYLKFRETLLEQKAPEFVCLLTSAGLAPNEIDTPMRLACDKSSKRFVAMVEADIDAAIRDRKMTPDWTAQSLALHIHASLQGAFVLATASGQARHNTDCTSNLVRYLRLLFQPD